jgi:tetratricopeptide (TPR) repeat protein
MLDDVLPTVLGGVAESLFWAARFPDAISLPLVDQWIGREPPEFQAAYANATETIKTNPADKQAYFVRGLACKSRGHFPEALADFCEVLRLDRDHARAWLMLSEVLVSMGQYDVARKARTHALELDSTLS